MIKVTEIEVYGLKAAMRGMRNPKDSWHKGDSTENTIGPNDLKLAKALHSNGPVHSKYKRQIFVPMDIDAPLYWWKEFDTYKVGTVANSCSTMHKIHAYPFTREMFSHEHLNEDSLNILDEVIAILNMYRKKFVESKERNDWLQLIQLLQKKINQKRTVSLNYENLTNMYVSRRLHKQDEWREFCKMIETLPYASDIIIPPSLVKE